jgi:hypothetical protein
VGMAEILSGWVRQLATANAARLVLVDLPVW